MPDKTVHAERTGVKQDYWMLMKVRRAVTPGVEDTGRPGLFLDLSAGYTDVFGWQKFTEPYSIRAYFWIYISITFTKKKVMNDNLCLSFIICKMGGTGEIIDLLQRSLPGLLLRSLPALNCIHLT